MAETPEAAPSPMTLSRWDEWSGLVSGSNNLNANYGLYAFRDPNTPYQRAYWTPGVGIFQYDVAGVGKPFTAAEMMNVQFIAGDVAAGMANRYCAAGGDSYTNRAAAWQPWSGLGGVAKSEALFQEMVGLGHPPFSTIGLVDGIENTGGMRTHTCLLSGVPTPCHFVDPAAAQGANWWANANVDGGQVAAGEAPLTAPFYVVKRNGYEERHWLAPDTGYDIDLSASPAIGINARPMDAEPGVRARVVRRVRPLRRRPPEPGGLPGGACAGPEPSGGRGGAAPGRRPDRPRGPGCGPPSPSWPPPAARPSRRPPRAHRRQRGGRRGGRLRRQPAFARGLALDPPASR